MNAFAGAVTSGSYLRGNGTNVVMNTIQVADVPTLNQSTTGSAATLTTGRTIAITGDLAYTSASFNGSANVTGTGTLATVNANVGSFTNATLTVNGKGLITAASSGTAPVTSVTATSPVASSGGATPAISLSAGYGDTLNPYASKTANFVLAAPNGSSGVPTFRAVVAADIPTLNQSTTGSAATLTTPRAIYGNNFDGSAALTQVIASTFGGTGNGFTKFTGATTSEKTYTLPDASSTIVVQGGALGTPSSGTVTNLTGTASININGTVGATTASSGAFTTLSATGVTTVQAGTAALPAITTSGDTNTGIFFPAADTIAFSEGGAEAMRIDSSGNLLVNTTTAQTGAKVSVTGGISGTITSGTAVASTSGTSIDFTSIPSWVKRITVMFKGVSTNGSSNWLVRLGTSGGIASTGYLGSAGYLGASPGGIRSTTGFIFQIGGGGQIMHGPMVITLQDSATNTWVQQGTLGDSSQDYIFFSGGSAVLSGALDRVRITTVNGTDTFDAGSINILYEG
jgi:hypothetical protein